MRNLVIKVGYVNMINILSNNLVVTTNMSILAYTFRYAQVFRLFQIT